MAGGKATPKKDREIKVSGGQFVKAGQILIRGLSTYKAGCNVKGLATLTALCSGTVYFTKKKTGMGRIRTFMNIKPKEEK
jgi:ribosomal protein L27